MKREQKRKRFHDSLLNMLYPPPSSLPSQEQDHNARPESLIFNPKLGNLSGEIDLSDATLNADELLDTEKSSSSGDDECEVEKLSRSQRKRIRKKKLKGAKSERRSIIGPLLPSGNIHGGTDELNEEKDTSSVQDVRQFVSEKKCGATSECSLVLSDRKRNKQRQRRLAKKVADDKGKSSCFEVGPKTDDHKEEDVSVSSG